MPLGGDDALPVVEGLNRASRFFRREIAREARLRHVPRLTFELDATFDTAGHIDSLLRRPEVARDTGRGDEPEAADGS